MTTVYLEKDGNRFTVSAKGHATGSEKMCAAISTLIYTLAGWLENSPEIESRATLNDANAHIEFYGAESVFELICIGFLQLEKTNDKYIRVTLREIG